MIFPVIVGINQFRNYPASNLRGCVRDAHENFAELSAHGFKVFKTLLDAQATELAAKTALEEAIAAAFKLGERPGIKHIISYMQSSHGTCFKGAGDIVHQALCMHDLSMCDGMIEDFYLAELLKQLPPWIILVIEPDACCSGDLLRSFNPHYASPRFLPFPEEEARPERGLFSRPMAQVLYEDGERKGVLLAACTGSQTRIDGNQTSADAYIDGKYCGAYTFHKLKVLREMGGWGMSYAELQAVTAKLLKAAGYSQDPTCEGEPELVNRPYLCGVDDITVEG